MLMQNTNKIEKINRGNIYLYTIIFIHVIPPSEIKYSVLKYFVTSMLNASGFCLAILTIFSRDLDLNKPPTPPSNEKTMVKIEQLVNTVVKMCIVSITVKFPT